MCFDPVTAGVLSFAVGAAQAVATFAAANQEAKATQENAATAFENEQRQSSLRQMQEADAANQKKAIGNIEEAQKVAEVNVSAAGSNVSGISVDNLVMDVRRQSARNRDTIGQNLKMTVAQIQQQKKASQAQAQSRINSAPRPSALSLVAGIGGAALSGVNTFNNFKTA